MTIDAMFLGPTDLFEFWASGTLSSSKERNPLLPKLATAILNSDKLVGDRLSGDDFPVRKLVGEQRQAQLVRMRQMIEGGGLEQSGPNRLEKWEAGWSENLLEGHLENFSAESVLPKYFRQNQIQRFNDELYETEGHGFEPTFLALLVDAVIEHDVGHFLPCRSDNPAEPSRGVIAEFGCGTGHHLMRLTRNPSFDAFQFAGLDWAESSQEILRQFSLRNPTTSIDAFNFDYFKPTPPASWEPASSIGWHPKLFFTVASLEQVGSRHAAFIDFCLGQKPEVVVNFEPIGELLGKDELGELSRQYFAERNYLSGYLEALEQREAKGQLKIHSAERVGFGSQFTEGYSLIRWSPTDIHD